ncbi:cutinase family protein [Modestobacter versicolor]|nr:cutinase family protein [Modestobacter versicolor]MBB3675869.1 hypothetical protein [Modestobacter versicolor]
MTGLGLAVAPPAMAGCNYEAIVYTVGGSGQAGNSLRSYEVSYAASTIVTEAARAGSSRQVRVENIDYPAVPWTRYVRVSRNWSALEDSEQQGVKALIGRLGAVFAPGGCIPPIILLGYSQGADVVARAVNQVPREWQDFIYVGQMGNPSFMPGRSQDYGTFERILWGVRPSFGLTQYPLTARVTPRSVDACLDNDPICNYDPFDLPGLANGRSAHYNYINSGYAGYVGRTLWQLSRHR